MTPPLVAFRLEDADELAQLRALAQALTDGNVSRLIRDALRAQHDELARLAEERRPS